MAGLFGYRPTVTERIPQYIQDGLMALGVDRRKANTYAYRAADVLGWTPVGAAAGAWDAGASAARRPGFFGKMAGLGTGAGGALLNALPGPDPSMAMFLGAAAKGADLGLLRKGAQMKKAGIGRDDIWEETGWFQGPDKKWRFEVDDSGAASDLKAAVSETYDRGRTVSGDRFPLNHILEHPRLYAAQPDAGDVLAAFMDAGKLPNGANGGFAQRFNAIALPAGQRPGEELSTVLHELQHYAQAKHGFAQGGRSDVDPDYARLAGEVEARNVEKRRMMTEAERRQYAPWSTQDTPDAEQIVRRRR